MWAKLEWATSDIDARIAWMARVSNPNAKPEDPHEKLIDYLIRHEHWSPFEMASICINLETTRDIGRQLLRHRSFHFQEFSQRYAAVQQDRPALSLARLQDNKNRQNSLPVSNQAIKESWDHYQTTVWAEASLAYNVALEMGIAKELARKLLPEGLTRTNMFMCGTVRDWYHYLRVRCGPSTQLEHRQLAQEIKEVCESVAPAVFRRLNDQNHIH